MARSTDLLFLREPQRKTLLATVTGTRGTAFLLDRTIFQPTSRRYRHPQPADRGEVWLGGDKRILTKVWWERGEVRHAVRGTVPAVGAAARCLLDADRREDASAAHAALHVVLSTFGRTRAAVLIDEPRVLGGRQFAVAARWTAWSPLALKALLDAANGAIARPLEVSHEYVPRSSARDLDAPPYDDGFALPQDEDVVRVIRIGDASRLPCDGTFPERTHGLGRIVARRVEVGRRGVRVQFHVAKNPRT